MGRFVVLASGTGTNFEAIARRVARTSHTLLALIVDRRDAGAIDRARSLDVPAVVVDYSMGRDSAEQRLASVLEDHAPDLVVLAGFMKILPATIVDRYRARILNIHPALLPRHPGTHAIERSYHSGDATVGVTIHEVDRGVDTGPIIAQCAIARLPQESLETVERRIHEVEHTLYPVVVCWKLEEIDRLGVSPR